MDREDGGGQVGAADFWLVEVGAATVLTFGPEPQTASRPEPSRPAGALSGGGPADLAQFEPVEATRRVMNGESRQARIEDHANPLDRQGGLGHVCGEDQLTSPGGPQRAVLLVGGKAAVQGEHEQILAAGDRLDGAEGSSDLLQARQESEQIAARAVRLGGESVANGVGEPIGQGSARVGRWEVFDRDGKRPPLGMQHRAIAKKPGDRTSIERC